MPTVPRANELRVKDILDNPEEWEAAIQVWPRAVQGRMRSAQVNGCTDSIIWMRAPDGKFTSKAFWKSFQPVGEMKFWANRVWCKYLPPKMSCLIWRVIHRAMPTDDNVSRLGIMLPSRCSCCVNASVESVEHLFFESQWSRRLWSLLAELFRRDDVRCIDGMLRTWFCNSDDDFISHVGSVLAAAGLWEIWRARNSWRYEERRVDWMRLVLDWPPRLAFLIKKPYRACMVHDQLLHVLRISHI